VKGLVAATQLPYNGHMTAPFPDLIIVAVVFAAFGVFVAYVAWCDSMLDELVEEPPSVRDPDAPTTSIAAAAVAPDVRP
jgi:hypothetical protein